MSIVENLQKKSLDRILFVAGMALTFIGFIIPAFVLPGWIAAKHGMANADVTLNMFAAAKLLNEPGTAYNATFMVVVWLCSIAGIVSFFFTSSVMSEVLIWLIGAGFGIAELITLPAYCEVTPLVGTSAIGSYIVAVGWTLALVAVIIGAASVKHAEIRKSI